MVIKMGLLWLVIACVGCIRSAGAINILGIVTATSKSHNHHASAIFNELANSGHSVTVLSPYTLSPKINHYSLEDTLTWKKEKFRSSWQEKGGLMSTRFEEYFYGLDRTRSAIRDKSFQKLLRSRMTVDVIVLDYDYNEALLGLAEFFDCPVILLSIGGLRGLVTRSLGLSYPLYNTIQIWSQPDLGFIEAISKFFSTALEQVFVDFFYHKQQEELYNEIFPESKITFQENVRTSIAKAFVSTLHDTSFLVPSDVVDVTGVHIPKTNFFESSFPDKLDNFIHSTENGCIYVSFGPDVNPLTLPKNLINTTFNVLYNRPEKIIWSWNGNTSAFATSTHFHMDKWLPQSDILRHDNVKLFITSGGELSLIEAVHHEVPVIGIPITQEEFAALAEIEGQGLGVKLDLKNVSYESLSWALNEIIDENRLNRNLLIKSENIRDGLLPPMKVVKHWLNYVYKHRRSIKTHTKLFTINFCVLDIYVFISLLLVIATAAIVLIVKYLHNTFKAFQAKKMKLY